MGQSGSAEFRILGQVAGHDSSVKVKAIVFGRVQVRTKPGVYTFARTTARIPRHVEKL